MPQLRPMSSRLALTVFACCGFWGWCWAARSAAGMRNAGQETPAARKLTYTKVLKGSTPEYTSVSVDSNGSGTYEGRKLDDPPSPKPVKLSAPTTKRLFELAASLDNFQSLDLESHKRVANLGSKTLIFEESGHKNQVQFNYTLNRYAQELVDWFEKITAVEVHVQ